MKLGMISLGCAKNLVDTELFLGVAKKYGIEITTNMNEADILVVNTCGFINSAKQEAIDTILELTAYGQHGKTIIAMGCLVERYLKDLPNLIPEVNIYFPISDYDHIDSLFKKITHSDASYKMDYQNRVLTTYPHSAYLRIADGCNNRCAYCAIPLIRGNFKSRPYQDIIDEAEYLSKTGVKEITLIAQDTTRYGTDLDNSPKLIDLIKGISQIEKIELIRVLYLYPDEITDELLKEFKTNKKLANYFDIPIQHVSDRLLTLMNRRGNKQLITNIIARIRSYIPNVIIRTTLIVGFPTENENDYNELYEFVKETKFDRLGTFIFSPEEDTAAFTMKPKVNYRTALLRYNQIMKLQSQIINEKNKELIGETFNVIVDSYDEYKKLYKTRSYAYAPDDVDGYIYVSSNTELKLGKFYKVRITKANVYDLYAEIYKPLR